MRYAMSSHGSDASSNGRGSDAWARPWSHLRIDRRSAAYCRITFAHPPINTITAATVAELSELVALIEQDDDLKVVVFDSADPEHYLMSETVSEWSELLIRFARSRVVTIAAIRGQTRGGGSEFVLACDMRFASRENTLIDRFDAAAGGAPVSRLAGLVGRGRALEVLLVAELDGPRAELYGYVNRTIPDARLEAEVDLIAERLARSDGEVLARIKAHVDRATLGA
jgi:enoyl-CoA hydratase/carnithine racemase